MTDKYKSPSIFEPPYFILKMKFDDLMAENFIFKNKINAIQDELEKYKIRQTDLLNKLYEKTKQQTGLNPLP